MRSRFQCERFTYHVTNEHFRFSSYRLQTYSSIKWPREAYTSPIQRSNTKLTLMHSSVHFHGSPHPRNILVNIRVNSILVWQSAFLAPAHNACKHPAAVPIRHWAGQRSPAIVSACVTAAFFESGTQKVLSYRSVVRPRKKNK